MWIRLLSGAVALLANPAWAQTAGPYLASKGNFYFPSDVAQAGSMQIERFGPGRTFGTAYGYDFGNGFKTEIETGTRSETAETRQSLAAAGNVRTTTVMLNGLYEVRDGAWQIKTFIGAGFGLMDINSRILGANNNDWTSAYQLRGGVTLGLNQKLLGSLGYEWTMGSKPHFSLAGIPTKLEVDRHGFVIGVNYKY
jgi:opacity protein-like surface antigen